VTPWLLIVGGVGCLALVHVLRVVHRHRQDRAIAEEIRLMNELVGKKRRSE
jgi:hypothetical protein